MRDGKTAKPVVTDHSADANKMVDLSASDGNALALKRELVRLVAAVEQGPT